MSIKFKRIKPVYPATEGLSQRRLRSIIYRLLNDLSDQFIESLLPPELADSGTTRSAAIRAIHFPQTWHEREAAREHLVLSEFFAMQMLIVSRRTHVSIDVGQ